MYRFITQFIWILVPIFCIGSEYRTFTDQQGREMEAKVTQVSGDDVFIERSDRLATKVSISVFSEEDQGYIHQWALEESLKNGAIEMRFCDRESDKSSSSCGGIKSTTFDAHYEVVLKNTTDQAIGNIRVEYLILKFTDDVAAKKRSMGEMERKKGTKQIEQLLSRSEKRLATDSFPMLETQLLSGWRWSGHDGGKARESKDKLEGIWVKVYVDDLLVLEDSRPQSLVRKEVW